MANKIKLARGTKSRIETIKETLSNYELVYSLDTKELGVKNNDGTVTYFGVVTELEWANILNKPNLDLKLDKNFTDLPNQATPLLTDVMAINRGSTIQQTTLGAILALIDTDIFIIVPELPETGIDNKIYLVPKESPEEGNSTNEYTWRNNEWELLGNIKLDLSGYYDKDEIDVIINAIEESLGFLVTNRVSSDIDLVLTHAMDATFSLPANSIILTIPTSDHGYYSGINFRIEENIPPFEIINDSGMDLKIIRYNNTIEEIILSKFSTVNISFYSDGINVYCYYSEIK